jgi:hypothetical protein
MMRVRDEYDIEVAIFLNNELLNIVQELLMIFLTRINEVPFFSSSQREAIGATKHPKIRVLTWY